MYMEAAGTPAAGLHANIGQFPPLPAPPATRNRSAPPSMSRPTYVKAVGAPAAKSATPQLVQDYKWMMQESAAKHAPTPRPPTSSTTPAPHSPHLPPSTAPPLHPKAQKSFPLQHGLHLSLWGHLQHLPPPLLRSPRICLRSIRGRSSRRKSEYVSRHYLLTNWRRCRSITRASKNVSRTKCNSLSTTGFLMLSF